MLQHENTTEVNSSEIPHKSLSILPRAVVRQGQAKHHFLNWSEQTTTWKLFSGPSSPH